MKLKVGENLICVKEVNNLIDMPLFIEDEIYTVLHVDWNYIKLEHLGSEFSDYTIGFIREHFKTLKEFRKEKLDKINGYR